MPPAIVGPGAPKEPPLAGTLLTVTNLRAVGNSQSLWPSLVDRACRVPSQPPTNTTPGIAVTAADMPARSAVARLATIGVNQLRDPSLRRIATIPPEVRPK